MSLARAVIAAARFAAKAALPEVLAALSALFLPGPAFAQDVPAAIGSDPPVDRLHPASSEGLQFLSHGKRVNAMLYLPAGSGNHPAVILLHGIPGYEQNLDLARAMQRAGWVVITFHYRGSWGSGGTFTLGGGCDDVDALLRHTASADAARKWHVDPSGIVLVGHSYGGFVAACAARRHPELAGVALIAPWDISLDALEFAKLSAKQADARAPTLLAGISGPLAGATERSLMRAIRTGGREYRLADAASELASRPLLLATATRDDPDDQAADLRAALAMIPNARLTYRLFDTDHGFNDRRIELESYVLNWLAELPGAPRPH